MATLDFEKPIAELETKIKELQEFSSDKNITLGPEIKKLRDKLDRMKQELYHNLSAWQRVQIARHPDRPYTLDYIRLLMSDFVELHGDRQFADDFAIVAGLAKLNGHHVMVIGHQKGRDTNDKIRRNFGCAHPEGYRKAMRLMHLAEKMHLPVIIFIDTPGAYPGIGAEERGQAQAIAENLKHMMGIKTPIIATIIGEGGSGGALGIGVADKVLILEHAYYSVISPEGCASILWRSSLKAPEAAEALKMTGEYLIEHNIVDEVIPEPLGGVHNDPVEFSQNFKKILIKNIQELSSWSTEQLLETRYSKFRKIGEFIEKEKKD